MKYEIQYKDNLYTSLSAWIVPFYFYFFFKMKAL